MLQFTKFIPYFNSLKLNLKIIEIIIEKSYK